MVPYASFPYADHALRECDVDPNSKASYEDHCDKLIEAAHLLKKLVSDLELMEDIPGFTVYEPIEKKEETKGEEEEEKEAPTEIQDALIEGMLDKFKDK